MRSGIQPAPEPRLVCLPVTPEEIDLLALSWASVLKHTTAEADILCLAVGFDVARLHAVLPQSDKIATARATQGTDPWQAVLRGLPPRYRAHDLLLLRPGIEVPQAWDARLALAANRQPSVAAVVPMCDSTPFFALLKPRKHDAIDLERIDRLLLAHSPRHDPEIPTLLSGCAYLKRAALSAIESQIADQAAMSAGEWCQWLALVWREAGLSVLGCDHVYVLDHAPERRRVELADVEALEDVRLINQAHPLTGLRMAIPELLAQHDVPSSPAASLPVQLHITHSWGGGLDYWVTQYCENDRERTNLVLRSIGNWGAFGQRIALYRSAAMDQPIRYWELDYPIRATALAHVQYRAILREIIAEFGVETILVSSLIGHALEALTSGLPTVMIAHDYYPFCPAILIHFGEVCEHCEPERLERCFSYNEQNRFFRNVTTAEWLGLRRRFIRLVAAESIRFVVPSPNVARHWQTLMPELPSDVFNLITHGLDFAPERLPTPASGKRLRVLILGSLAPQKGRTLLEQLWPLIADRVELYLVGCDGSGEAIKGQPGMTLIPRYRHAELRDILGTIQPEVGLLLSVSPETFSYTLSELWLLGIPVVATDLGSFSDRIEDGVSGFLCQPRAQAIAKRLLAIEADRTCLAPMRATLAGFRHRSVAEMIADYHALIPLPEFSAGRYLSAPARLSGAFAADQSTQALHVDVRAPFGQVAREFGDYVERKLMMTPRLKAWQKQSLTRALQWMLRMTTAANRIRRNV